MQTEAPPVFELLKMSIGQTLRALVNERLAAAAEDIFVLFEKTLAEYGEELCRSREENQRKQVLGQTVELVCGNIQFPSESPGFVLNQEIPETQGIKNEPEEQSVKLEEGQLPMPVPESSAVGVTEGYTKLSIDTHSEDNWDPQMETKADEDSNQVQIRSIILSPQNQSAPQTSVLSGTMSGADKDLGKKHQCPFCLKRFVNKGDLPRHIRVHTGEKPYSCPVCQKTFAHKSNLDSHKRTHTGEKPYSCTICNKTFTQKGSLDLHRRTHTGEKPYSCVVCQKTFSQKSVLDSHMRTHTADKRYNCSVCETQFSDPSALRRHQKVHSGEKCHTCLACDRIFAHRSTLVRHIRTQHTGENPVSV